MDPWNSDSSLEDEFPVDSPANPVDAPLVAVPALGNPIAHDPEDAPVEPGALPGDLVHPPGSLLWRTFPHPELCDDSEETNRQASAVGPSADPVHIHTLRVRTPDRAACAQFALSTVSHAAPDTVGDRFNDDFPVPFGPSYDLLFPDLALTVAPTTFKEIGYGLRAAVGLDQLGNPCVFVDSFNTTFDRLTLVHTGVLRSRHAAADYESADSVDSLPHGVDSSSTCVSVVLRTFSTKRACEPSELGEYRRRQAEAREDARGDRLFREAAAAWQPLPPPQ